MTTLFTNFIIKLIGSNSNNFEHRKNKDLQQTYIGDNEIWEDVCSRDCWDPDI